MRCRLQFNQTLEINRKYLYDKTSLGFINGQFPTHLEYTEIILINYKLSSSIVMFRIYHMIPTVCISSMSVSPNSYFFIFPLHTLLFEFLRAKPKFHLHAIFQSCNTKYNKKVKTTEYYNINVLHFIYACLVMIEI